VIKVRRMQWMGHVAHVAEVRNAYRILFGNLEEERPVERPRR
jgi:hypothetical protein